MGQRQGIYKELHIAAIREEVPGFKTFVFAEGHGIAYKAGQYLTLVRFEGNEELRRSYSITSSPALGEPLSIGVKRVENGVFSRLLVDSAAIDDTVLSSGSGGFFVLPEGVEQYNKLFFFAAGSGITPVYSLLKTVLKAHPTVDVVLVYSNASEEKTIFLQQLRALQVSFPDRFHLNLLFSNNPDLSRARLHRDLIFSYLAQFAVLVPATLFYICGPENYMRLCTYTLQERGVPPANIKKENFYFSAAIKRDASPPDTASHSVTVLLRGEAHRFTVHYPFSILKSAKQLGLSLPYSCEAGRCGNCVAKCIEGSVWHSYNEVLTEKELSEGLVLTCVGHPVGGNVVLEIG